MIFSYYPGCTLKTKAKELDAYARRSAEALGILLEELPEWQCCGGVYTTARDEIATKLSSVRALMSAKEEGHELVTLCSACHNVIKQTKYALDTDDDMAFKVSNYMKCDARAAADTKVIHYLELLRDVVGFDEQPITDVFCFVPARSCNSTIRKIQGSWRILSERSALRR